MVREEVSARVFPYIEIISTQVIDFPDKIPLQNAGRNFLHFSLQINDL